MARFCRYALRTRAAHLVLGLVMLLPMAPSASARNSLLGSEPAAGAVLASSPAEVVLTFAEPIEPAYSSVAILDGRRHRLDGGVMHRDPTLAGRVHVTLERPAAGPCQVVWKVVGKGGRLTSGHFTFQVGP
jgi:methionine-rich copper-binding protein CopC